MESLEWKDFRITWSSPFVTAKKTEASGHVTWLVNGTICAILTAEPERPLCSSGPLLGSAQCFCLSWHYAHQFSDPGWDELSGPHGCCFRLLPQSMYSRVPECQVTTYYYVGFAYLMMRRYQDAIRVFANILLYIQRTKSMFQRTTYKYEMVRGL